MPERDHICPKCGRLMRYDSSQIAAEMDWPMWVCDPCDDKAIASYNERREWDYYHS